MASTMLSVWEVRWCPSCGLEVAVHEREYLGAHLPEVWCTGCRRALEAVPDTPARVG